MQKQQQSSLMSQLQPWHCPHQVQLLRLQLSQLILGLRKFKHQKPEGLPVTRQAGLLLALAP